MAAATALAGRVRTYEQFLREYDGSFVEWEAGVIVPKYWILDPATRQADFFLRGADARFARRLPDTQGVYTGAVVEGSWIDIAWLWRRPLPTLRQVLKEWERKAQ